MPLALTIIGLGLAVSFAGCLGDELRPLVPIGWFIWAFGGLLAYRRGGLATRHILFVAILLRAACFFMPPALSDDVHRYLWDGWISIHGENPFQYLPDDSAVDWVREDLDITLLNSPGYYSVYPATSQVLFAIGAGGEKLGHGLGIWTIKLALGLVEMLGLFLLARLVGSPALLLYAWHPTVVIESWGQAHSEAATSGLLVVCCFALSRNRAGLAVAALALAVWTKLHPVLLVPWLLAIVGWRWCWVALLSTVVVWLPFWASFVPSHLKDSIDLYTGSFEFNAGFYELFVLIGDPLLSGSGLLGGSGDSSKVVALLLQCILLGLLPVLYAVGCQRSWTFPQAAALTYGLVLVTTATMHPWYTLPLLALVAMAERPAWHWQFFAVASSMSYLFYTHGQAPYVMGMVVAWGGWSALILLGSRKPLTENLQQCA